MFIQVRSSQVDGGGEGLYARRNLVKGEIVAFYNGVLFAFMVNPGITTNLLNVVFQTRLQWWLILLFASFGHSLTKHLDLISTRSDYRRSIEREFQRVGRLPVTRSLPTRERWLESSNKELEKLKYLKVWGERMDIPASHLETSTYCATLGHKVNHCFVYNCTEWWDINYTSFMISESKEVR